MPEEDITLSKKMLIAARERGPGPARYRLPTCLGYISHDLTKKMMPAHTFGKKLSDSMFKNECSPGPAYLVSHQLTRFGVDGTPRYSMLGRAKEGTPFGTPAPSAYYKEKVFPQGEQKAPVYSMGSRTRYRKRDANPSSNSYTLPSMLGRNVLTKESAPSYTLSGRALGGSFSKTPGPGRYDEVKVNNFNNKAPAYSMLGRNYYTSESCKKQPGPGAHSPEKVYINKPSAPHFSMGIRHSEFLTPLIVEVQD